MPVGIPKVVLNVLLIQVDVLAGINMGIGVLATDVLGIPGSGMVDLPGVVVAMIGMIPIAKEQLATGL
jgi:hypothetical protein